MNNPNTLKIPVPVPVPVPFPLSFPKPKSNKTVSLNSNYSSFSNPKIKSSFMKQIKEDIGENEVKEKYGIKSNDNINDSSSQIIEIKKDSSIMADNLKDSPLDNSKNNSPKSNLKINESQESSKEKSSDIAKKEINITNSLEKDCVLNEKNSSNSSGHSSKENKEKTDLISSIKSNDKSSFEFLSNADHKKLSLEKLNNFLQNNKPISNFNNPNASTSIINVFPQSYALSF